MKALTKGEHLEGMALSLISLTVSTTCRRVPVDFSCCKHCFNKNFKHILTRSPSLILRRSLYPLTSSISLLFQRSPVFYPLLTQTHKCFLSYCANEQVTVGFILLLPVVDISGIELAALALYFLIFFSSLSAYATAVSNLRAAVAEYQVCFLS